MYTKVCPCGHRHWDHLVHTWLRFRTGEIGICHHKDEIIKGYKTVTNYSYDSDSDDDVGWKPSIIHHNYGGGGAPYVANSYSNTHGNITYITPRSNGGYSSSYGSSNTIPIKETIHCKCGECRCDYCLSDEGRNEQKATIMRNRNAEKEHQEQQLRILEAKKEERRRWREGNFAERRAQRGTFKAILRAIKEVFICSC
ncbi:hypothetical protein E24_00148 [Faustovirus]|nr:hypothetical protein PRJ_Fausto_00133 [Faustovirus]AMN83079.1 hypothetical protein E24_00148 [Faustovirus]AMN85048.1 hypothetical protein E23_00147 [Faustovirus]QBR99047.1 hypothetical protein [Faustovirus mariensis]